MTLTTEISPGQLADLVKEVQSGHEVVLTQGSKPIARLVPAVDQPAAMGAGFEMRSFKGHRVLTPCLSQAEIAEDMFDQR